MPSDSLIISYCQLLFIYLFSSWLLAGALPQILLVISAGHIKTIAKCNNHIKHCIVLYSNESPHMCALWSRLPFFWHCKLHASAVFFFLQLISDIVDVICSKDGPKLSAEALSQSAVSHEFYCEKAWQNIIPTLKLWHTELSGLQVSQQPSKHP